MNLQRGKLVSMAWSDKRVARAFLHAFSAKLNGPGSWAHSWSVKSPRNWVTIWRACWQPLQGISQPLLLDNKNCYACTVASHQVLYGTLLCPVILPRIVRGQVREWGSGDQQTLSSSHWMKPKELIFIPVGAKACFSSSPESPEDHSA